jgi:hypothetical protein
MPIIAISSIMQPLAMILAAVVTATGIMLPLDSSRGRVRRRTGGDAQRSILVMNQVLRGPTPDPAVPSGDALMLAIDTPPPTRDHRIEELHAIGSGAATPDRSRKLGLGARQTKPSPRLKSLPIRSARDQMARSFVQWVLSQGHAGEHARQDVWNFAQHHFANQNGCTIPSMNQFFEALVRVAGVERRHDRPVYGPTGQQTLTTYTFFTELEVALIARDRKRIAKTGCALAPADHKSAPIRGGVLVQLQSLT